MKILLGVIRAPFLLLTPAVIVLGLALAMQLDGSPDWPRFALVLLGALTAHISVNALNEYHDVRSGLDRQTQRTPFSGGSGVLLEHPELTCLGLAIGVIALGITVATGAWLLWATGPKLLALGLLGVVIIVTYTPWITRRPLLSLITPGVAFGPLMVGGTALVLTGTYETPVFIAALVPFFLVNNLLLLNQFPDVEADRRAGRRNLPILLGRRRSAAVYGLMLLLAYATLALAAAFSLLPPAILLGGLTLPLAAWASWRAWQHSDDIPRLIPAMAVNVVITVLTPVLMAVGLFVA